MALTLASREQVSPRRQGIGLVLTVLLLGLSAAAGCDPYHMPPYDPTHPVPDPVDVRELAPRWGLSIVASTETFVTLKNKYNAVVIYADPHGQAFVNGQPVGSIGGFYYDGQTMFVPAELEPQVKHALRDPSRPPLVIPTPTPRPDRPPPERLASGKVVIDAGHGGKDSGTTGAGESRPEKDVNLAIAQVVAEALRARGVEVVMTRSNDRFIELDDRVAIANRSGANLFVAIHADYAENRSAEGHTVITPRLGNADASRAASLISNRMTSAGSPERGVKADIRHLRVLEGTKIPAILVETGFLSNSRDTARLLNPAFQQKLGDAIADGIIDYLKRK